MTRLLFVALALLLSQQSVGAQLSYSQGQNVSPGYEGWEQNEDGSFGRGRYGRHVGITALCALAYSAPPIQN